ncbi:hypothetical protein MJH54_30915, partial [Salmonella enterica subsp. enterica serovar Montevideo]|nr:hypothetical protein [Salmonella enterica subsp. enterica serovar Montevideo]
GLPAYALIGSWPAVNGYFFIPVAGQCLAALAFDDTGTTRIGKASGRATSVVESSILPARITQSYPCRIISSTLSLEQSISSSSG